MKYIVGNGYNQITKQYLAERDKLKSGKYVQKLLKLLPKKSTILDVGCGAGIPVDDVLLKAGHFVLGIDISSKMIELARKNCPGGSYLIKDMLELRNEEMQLEAIVAMYSIFHIDRDKHEQLLKTLVSLVKRGGYLLITMGDVDFEGEHELYGVKMWSSQWGTAKNREIIHKLNSEVLIDDLEKSGGESHQVFLLRKK